VSDEEEDGTLRYCEHCAEDTPHTLERIDTHVEWICEFCKAKWKQEYWRRYELPVLKV